jgi:predicted nucleic acid-binding protein
VADTPSPEHLVCDTTVVSLIAAAVAHPERIAHWPAEIRDRLDRAVLAISVFTQAEVRSGYLRANWGERRIAEAERALAAYLLLPLDYEVLDHYVRLRARYLGQIGDNDLWIAATAIARGWPLVACDLDFCKLRDELDLIYLARDPNAPRECP